MPLQSTGCLDPSGAAPHAGSSASSLPPPRVCHFQYVGNASSVGRMEKYQQDKVAEICLDLLKVRKRTDPIDLKENPPWPFLYALIPWRNGWREPSRIQTAMTALETMYPVRKMLTPDAWFSVFVLLVRVDPKKHAALLDACLEEGPMKQDSDWALEVIHHWMFESDASMHEPEFREVLLNFFKNQWLAGARSEKLADVMCELWGITHGGWNKWTTWEALFPLLPDVAQGEQFGDAERVLAGMLLALGEFLDTCTIPESCMGRLAPKLGTRAEEARQAYGRSCARQVEFQKVQSASPARQAYLKLKDKLFPYVPIRRSEPYYSAG